MLKNKNEIIINIQIFVGFYMANAFVIKEGLAFV